MNDDPSASSRRHRRSLRLLLLDARFQLKYTLAIVIAGAVISGALGYAFYDRVRANSTLAATHEDPEFRRAMEDELAHEDARVLWTLVGAWLAFIGALFVIGILATHRMVGPIYVVDRSLRQLADGGYVAPRTLRPGDEFTALFARVGALSESLRDERCRDAATVDAAVADVEAVLAGFSGGGGSDVATALRVALQPLRALAEQKRGKVAAS